MNSTPYLFDEVAAGFLDHADENSAGLFLTYTRSPDTFTCSGFRLVLAPSLEALRRYIDGKPPGVALSMRLVHLRYPGQLAATEQYFGCKLEVARSCA